MWSYKCHADSCLKIYSQHIYQLWSSRNCWTHNPHSRSNIFHKIDISKETMCVPTYLFSPTYPIYLLTILFFTYRRSLVQMLCALGVVQYYHKSKRKLSLFQTLCMLGQYPIEDQWWALSTSARYTCSSSNRPTWETKLDPPIDSIEGNQG